MLRNPFRGGSRLLRAATPGFPLGFAFALVVAGGLALGAGPLQAAPRAKLVEPLELKLGEVEPDAVQKLDWTLRNDGDAPLLILAAEPTCYCTTAKLDSKQVAPGASTKIHVRIDPSDFVGTIHKGVEIQTNDPATPKQLIDVELNVRPGIAVIPPEIDLGAVGAEGSKEFAVDLKAAKSRPFKVTSATSESPWIALVQEPLQTDERAGVRLFVKAKPGTPAGPLDTKVVITTDDAAKPRIEIPVRAASSGGMTAVPAKLVFEAVAAGSDVGTVALKSDKGQKVMGVKSSTPSLEPTLAPQPDGSYQVRVKVASGAKPGRIYGKLIVATGDAAQPELVVPVLGVVK